MNCVCVCVCVCVLIASLVLWRHCMLCGAVNCHLCIHEFVGVGYGLRQPCRQDVATESCRSISRHVCRHLSLHSSLVTSIQCALSLGESWMRWVGQMVSVSLWANASIQMLPSSPVHSMLRSSVTSFVCMLICTSLTSNSFLSEMYGPSAILHILCQVCCRAETDCGNRAGLCNLKPHRC